MHLRASLLTGTLTLSLSATGLCATGAFAQEFAQGGGQAEWRQNYDAASRIRVPRSTTPILSGAALAATE